MSEDLFPVKERLSKLLAEAGLPPLDEQALLRFSIYYSLFSRWNARINLSSIRDPEQVLRRHFVESISCAQQIPQGVATLLDFGSGGGLPGAPISICRREISVTLAESQGKKAAFLQEVARMLSTGLRVHAGRAEELPGEFDCVTLRAVDRMEKAISVAAGLVKESGYLVLMTTRDEASDMEAAAGPGFRWRQTALLFGDETRVFEIGQKRSA
jgi:16S rRNA (guanine527-N7)-methyltransferase